MQTYASPTLLIHLKSSRAPATRLATIHPHRQKKNPNRLCASSYTSTPIETECTTDYYSFATILSKPD